MTIAATDYVGPTSMFATDLSLTRMPDWVRVATLHRTARMERPDWHTLARMAIDVCDLPILPRTAARVLVDWHGASATSVVLQVRDIAKRIPASRQKTSSALTRLVDDGWLSRVEQPGRGSILTLLIPLMVSPTVTPHLSPSVTPVSPSVTPPVTDGDTIRGIGAEGQSQGHVDSSVNAARRALSPAVAIDHIDPHATWDDYA